MRIETRHKRQSKSRGTSRVLVRALHTKQGEMDVYSFFMSGRDITRIIDIKRVNHDDSGHLKGFQRKDIRNHVRATVQYLNRMHVLFPNAITLAFSPEVRFTQSRSPKAPGLSGETQAGLLSIPAHNEGEQVGWIVDGQQRIQAMDENKNNDLPVPVVAFMSKDMSRLRKQFVLINKARPLPRHLITELLPDTHDALPPEDLASRRIPTELGGAGPSAVRLSRSHREKRVEVTRHLADLLTPKRLWSRSEVLTKPCPVPREAGVYAWYFRRVPPGVPRAGCRRIHGATLLYVGISPKCPPMNGTQPSRQRLLNRVRYHFRGNAAGSTLRLTLGCLLAESLGIGLRRVGSGKRLTFADGELKLSEWMAENAFVCWLPARKPWLLETQLLAKVSLPLNLQGNARHPFHKKLSAAREYQRQQARRLPLWTRPTSRRASANVR